MHPHDSVPKHDPRVPHFLRVTQALAFVSGIGLPAMAACGGSVLVSASDSGVEDAGAGDDRSPVSSSSGPGPYNPVYGGSSSGAGVYDPGSSSAAMYIPGSSGASVYSPGYAGVDAGPTGVLNSGPADAVAYDGGDTGVAFYDGAPLGVGVLEGGGPLVPPELPA